MDTKEHLFFQPGSPNVRTQTIQGSAIGNRISNKEFNTKTYQLHRARCQKLGSQWCPSKNMKHLVQYGYWGASSLLSLEFWSLYHLVGGFNTSEKYDFVSWDYYSQYMEKKMFQTTNQASYIHLNRRRMTRQIRTLGEKWPTAPRTPLGCTSHPVLYCGFSSPTEKTYNPIHT